MKDYLERHALSLTILLVLAFGAIGFLTYRLEQARGLQVSTLQRIDQPPTGGKLPGLQAMISARSEKQLDTFAAQTPHILGLVVSKVTYGKTDDPVLYTWGGSIDPVKQYVKTLHDLQLAGQGMSSEELSAANKISLRNSDEAKNGLIKCGSLAETNFPQLTPSIAAVAKGACRATIPPFDPNVNLAIVVVIDIDGTTNDAEIQAVRRMLLQLQIDIFNRDYQGRETWAAPL